VKTQIDGEAWLSDGHLEWKRLGKRKKAMKRHELILKKIKYVMITNLSLYTVHTW
jgi:hypothetical protein